MGTILVAVMALSAVLGVQVLRWSAKERGSVKKAGQTVGWSLVVVGLAGFLGGAVTQGLKNFLPRSGYHAAYAIGGMKSGCPYLKKKAGPKKVRLSY